MTKPKTGLSALAVNKPKVTPAEAPAPSSASASSSKEKPEKKRVHVSVYLTPEAHEALTDLGYDLRKKPKELHREAFNLLFAKHNKPQVA